MSLSLCLSDASMLAVIAVAIADCCSHFDCFAFMNKFSATFCPMSKLMTEIVSLLLAAC